MYLVSIGTRMWNTGGLQERITMVLERPISMSFQSTEVPDLCHMIVANFHTELEVRAALTPVPTFVCEEVNEISY